MLPPLSTLRLCLQPITLTDVNAIRAIVSDPLFVQASYGCQMPASDNQLLRWTLAQQKQHQNGNGCCYTLRFSLEQELTGLVTLQPNAERVELSYWLKASRWRQGLMTEAIFCILNEWQRCQPQITVYSCCSINNKASIGLLEKIGMQSLATEEQNEVREFILGGITQY